MIYLPVDPTDPIRQGDIFRGIPRVDCSLETLAIVDESETYRQVSWQEVFADGGDAAVVTALLPVKPVTAIVITQNCDAVRGEYLCLCQIDDFLLALGKKDAPPTTPKKWQSLIVQHSKTNQRWFYLPASEALGFPLPMAVDFRVILRVPRSDLETARERLRAARLDDVAADHFRESLGHFFRRYAYNEWYPLNKAQFEAYAEAFDEPIEPYDWQK